ncbi:helix-turn-helix transcriptional regulator [Rhodococcus sp. H29-C3]|uniref:helix-turn-helix domain-containing protein n=1 Tax=Rhodococcus sp. H29-C3 TaxID=3046307 RepID=UPI0024BBA467|nr:helix-turn-helix transcriptional regulator [Rhodococcus sp. H29-C3]MDJ0359711.1 helix-turn-helix transcriptional regulator [Rhodococcus sp. H29-C3]
MATRRVALGPTGETVRANMADVRKRQGLTLRDLADRLQNTDRPLAHNTISEIERGARRVDVDDLVAIAGALRVAPNLLLMPRTESGDTVVTATTRPEISAREYWFFLEGMRPLDVETLTRTEAFDFALRSLPAFLPLHTSMLQRSSNESPLLVRRRMQSDGLSVELEAGVSSQSIFVAGSGPVPEIDSNRIH